MSKDRLITIILRWTIIVLVAAFWAVVGVLVYDAIVG